MTQLNRFIETGLLKLKCIFSYFFYKNYTVKNEILNEICFKSTPKLILFYPKNHSCTFLIVGRKRINFIIRNKRKVLNTLTPAEFDESLDEMKFD